MNRVFADASFWIAHRDRRDEHHERAQVLVRRMIAERVQFVVTPYIFAEVHAYFSRHRILRERIIRDFWDNPAVHFEEISVKDQRDAIELLRTNQDKAYSFCDALSFGVIERMQVSKALSFDGHFRQFGQFTVLE